MQKNQWFEVDTEGLKQLQLGKDKTFVVRELIQNAWDEKIKECKLDLIYFKGAITVKVTDDSKEGFKNLRDAYTLFGHTSKRRNAEQRGRFNFGEKQLISVCNKATIKTTKGTITFTESGRHEIDDKRESGTIVQIEISGTKEDYEEMVTYAKTLLVPKKIKYTVNGELVQYKEPFVNFEASLITEIQENGFLKKVKRKTKVDLLKEKNTRIYEMGIPIMEIDCEYSVDVQQKVPLSFDRDSLNQVFMRELYADVLNNIYESLSEDNCSAAWVRVAMKSKRISKDAVNFVMEKRYGDKYCVANPFDKNSIDEAISKGYRVITGSEMSKEEWGNVKGFDLIQSTSELFGMGIGNAPVVEPNENQKITADYAKRIMKRCMGIDISVRFIKGGQQMVAAQYGNKCLTFNVSKLNGFFEEPISERTTDLILHELGHECGNHTEHSYHDAITNLGAKLTMLALEEPEFFKRERLIIS